MRGRDAVQDLISRELVVDRSAHPELGPTLSRMRAANEICRVLPGIYGPPRPRWTTRVAAAMVWDPDAVICGRASAALDFWPTLRVDSVEVGTARHRVRADGFVFSQRAIPVELIWSRSGLRRTCAPLSALDLCVSDVGGDAIDQVLRTRAATLADLNEAVRGTVHRPGNNARRRLLLDSRAEPWSEAERAAHRLLRSAGIDGWVANHPLKLSDGEQVFVYYLDICFRGSRVAIEIDGRLHHSGSSAFESDRYRQNDVVIAGWRVLRFTWDMLINRPEYVIRCIRAILR